MEYKHISTRAAKERLLRKLEKEGRKLECLDKGNGTYAVRSASGSLQYASTLKGMVEREGVLRGFERY
jgi:hypothetical protein